MKNNNQSYKKIIDKNFIKFMNNYTTQSGDSILNKYSAKEIFVYDYKRNCFNYSIIDSEDFNTNNFYIDSIDLYEAFKFGFKAGLNNE